jgi:hypothetical protein
MSKHEGDNTLSSNDRQLWALCYSTLQRFGCLTMFKEQHSDVRFRISRSIRFYVPASHVQAAEVTEYLKEELCHMVQLPGQIGEDWTPGTTVSIVAFSGITGYLTHDEVEPLVQAAVENFIAAMTEEADKKALQ